MKAGARPAIPAIRAGRIVDTITQHLRDLILDQELEPDTVLLQTEWAERLGVSRTPLREAFRLLENDGLVRISNGNRTVKVVRYTDDELRDMYELREMIDGLATRRLAAAGGVSPVLGELRSLLQAMEAASTPFRASAWFAAHTAFHLCILDNCGNQRLRAQASVVRTTSMSLYPTMGSRRTAGAGDLREILDVGHEQHQAIIDAIEAGNPEKAERTARRHIRSTLKSDLIRRATRDSAKLTADGH